MISLFYMAEPVYGGWVSYTAHLYRALVARGYEVALYKVGARVENKRRPFADGVEYRNIDIDYALALTRGTRTVITAVGPKLVQPAASLLQRGAGLVVHDPTEMRDELLSVVRRTGSHVVTIRAVNVENLRKLDVIAAFVRHPYEPPPVHDHASRTLCAITLCRIDWDKRTDIVVEANKLLSGSDKILMFGAENRLYTHHKLVKIDARWRENYRGTFPRDIGSAIELASKANYVVDMSIIKGDGGGTQYTFLEAWDAGAVLIVNRAWLRPDDDLQEGVNVLAVDTPEELARLVVSEPLPALVAKGKESLEQHDSYHVVPALAQAWGW